MPRTLPSTVAAPAGVQRDFVPQYTGADQSLAIAAVDSDGLQQTRSIVSTDEGSYRLSCSGSSFGIAIGSCTWTNGSNQVTGSGFLSSPLRVGDYVGQGSGANVTWFQVRSFTDTAITLASAFSGTTSTVATFTSTVAASAGTGTTASVGSGVTTLASGTTANSVAEVKRSVDRLPLIKQCELSVSQRIANQDVCVGFYDEAGAPSSIKYYAWFRFTGTNNAVVLCESAYNRSVAPTGNEIESTSVTIPVNNSAAMNEYRIEVSFDEVRFLVNKVVVAVHAKTIIPPADTLCSTIRLVNGSSNPASTTTVLVNYDVVVNYSRVTVGQIQTSNLPLAAVSLTDVAGSIAVASTSQQVFASNIRRRFLLVQNQSAEPLWLKFDQAATVGNSSRIIVPGETVTYADVVPTGTVNIIGETATQNYFAQQG